MVLPLDNTSKGKDGILKKYVQEERNLLHMKTARMAPCKLVEMPSRNAMLESAEKTSRKNLVKI